MKPDTKKLRDALRAMGVRPRQVRTDRMLGGTTATIFDEDGIETVSERAGDLVAAGYAVVVSRFADGCPATALVTTDRRRTGVRETSSGQCWCTAPASIGGAR